MVRIIFSFVIFILPNLGVAAVSSWTDIDVARNQIRVPVTINGIERIAMLDSGSTVNAISAEFIREHGQNLSSGGKVNITGVFGTSKRRLYSDIQLELWGSSFEVDQMVELDLPEDIGVLIGAGLFEQFVFQFDFPNNRMRLMTRDSLDLRKLKNVKSKKADDGVMVKVNLNQQKEVWLLLDTGANTGVLTRRLYAEELGWLDSYEVSLGRSAGVNESNAMERFMLPSLELGPYELADVSTAVPVKGGAITFGSNRKTTTGSQLRGRKSAGILGYDVLKHFMLTIDYKKGYVRLDAPE